MTRRLLGCALAVCLGFGVAAAAVAAPPSSAYPGPGFWSTPTIQGYGKIHFLPKAAYQPDPKATYKLVFAVTHAPAKPGEVSPGLDHVARTINLYVAAGVPESHIHIVAIVFGAATPLALDDAHYRATFGMANPDDQLIKELRAAGVDVAVCAQAMAEHHFPYAWKSSDVTLALSGLTTVLDLQQQGYALFPM